MIRILHLSDLHYVDGDYDQNIVLKALLGDLRKYKDEYPIDIIIFSGDLVKIGEDKEQFEKVKAHFLDHLMGIYDLDSSRIFIAPGNHDISRKAARENVLVDKGISAELTTIEKVNRFIDDARQQKPYVNAAFERLKNFDDFLKTLNLPQPKVSLPIVRVYQIRVGDYDIGCACFNTAWRCTGEPNDVDKGQLLLGERSIDVALEALSGCDITLGIFHHPLEYLAPFEAEAVESRLQAGFDFLFFGHTHSLNPTIKQSARGRAFYSQSGCLYESRKYHNGYQILEIDSEKQAGKIHARTYFNGPREFRPAVNVLDENGELAFDLPEVRNTYTNIDKFLGRIRHIIRERANKHITLALDPDAALDDIYQVFVCPPLQFGHRTKKAISEVLDKDITVDLNFILNSVDPILLVGKRQSGKTSLIHYLAVKFAEGVGDISRVPLILDARTLKVGDYSFRRQATAYLQDENITQSSLATALQDFPLAVILDNFDDENDRHIALLRELIGKANNRIICVTSDENAAGFVDTQRKAPLDTFKEIQISSLPRKSIRILSEKRASSSPDRTKVFSNVMANLVSAHLPWNGYIVSLLLWAYNQNKEFENLNESVLIESVVNFLLEKGDFAGAFRKNFDSRSKEILLQALSIYIGDQGDAVEEELLYKFVFEFFKSKGLDFSAPDTIKRLIDVGILTKEGDAIAFRFRVFQEYFFSCAMKEDPDLRSKVSNIETLSLYLREIDLFTSSTRKSFGFMEKALEWIEAIRMKDNRLAKNQDIQSAKLSGSGAIGLSGTRRRALRKNPLTIDQIDEMLEKAEQLALKRRKAQRDAIAKSKQNGNNAPIALSSNLFLAIELLGKIVRNSEFDDKDSKVVGLEYYIDFSQEIIITIISLIEEAVGIILEHKDEFPKEFKESDLENIANTLKILLSTNITVLMAEQIGTEKLIGVIQEMIRNDTNTFGRKFFLTCFLFDLRVAGAIEALYELAEANQDKYKRLIILEKLCHNYTLHRYQDGDKAKLENAIADVEVLLGANKESKGNLITHRRQKSQISEL